MSISDKERFENLIKTKIDEVIANQKVSEKQKLAVKNLLLNAYKKNMDKNDIQLILEGGKLQNEDCR